VVELLAAVRAEGDVAGVPVRCVIAFKGLRLAIAKGDAEFERIDDEGHRVSPDPHRTEE